MKLSIGRTLTTGSTPMSIQCLLHVTYVYLQVVLQLGSGKEPRTISVISRFGRFLKRERSLFVNPRDGGLYGLKSYMNCYQSW